MPPAPKPLAPAPAPSSAEPAAPPLEDYRLQRAKDGSGDLLYDATAFSARIARDGSVRFKDKGVSVLSLIPFLPGPPPPGVPTLQGMILGWGRKGPKAPPTNRDSPPNDPHAAANTTSRYHPDQRDDCRYPRSCFFEAKVVLVGATWSLDITDAVMRLRGQDPYRYQKARFLTATRELRVRMAGRAHAEDMQRSASELPRRLKDIACDTQLTLSERRQVLEALGSELDGSQDADRSAALIRDILQSLTEPDGGVSCP